MKKFFVYCGIIILSIILLGLAILVGLGYYLSPQGELQDSDAIVVISGGQTTARADRGIELYKEDYAPYIVFSGAALDDGPSNAAAMRTQAVNDGVPGRAIKTDEDAKDTYENAINSKRILDELGAKNIILVTSPYHQRRAYETFRKVLGPEYTIHNESAFDSRWSKSQWWSRGFAFNITLSESAKLLYILVTGNYK